MAGNQHAACNFDRNSMGSHRVALRPPQGRSKALHVATSAAPRPRSSEPRGADAVRARPHGQRAPRRSGSSCPGCPSPCTRPTRIRPARTVSREMTRPGSESSPSSESSGRTIRLPTCRRPRSSTRDNRHHHTPRSPEPLAAVATTTRCLASRLQSPTHGTRQPSPARPPCSGMGKAAHAWLWVHPCHGKRCGAPPGAARC